MAQDQGKPRFIRKNGKVIPVGGKKKGGGNAAPKNKKKPKNPPKFQRDVNRVKKFEFAGNLGGLALGVSRKGSLIEKFAKGALGTFLGGVAGREVGITAGSVIKKRKGDSKKKLGQRAVNRADKLRKASNTGF